MEPIGRRSVLTGLGVGALGLAAGMVPRTVPAANAAVSRQRVVVIGAGVAGVATAWLLDGEHDVTLLEADSELGGHARGLEVRVGDKTIAVDGGAQYFGPGTHPIYMQLVDKVLQVPTVRISMDFTVGKFGETKPIMVSPNPPKRLLSTLQLAYLPALQAMATLVLSGTALEASRDWRPTLQEFVQPLPIPQQVKDDFVYPFYASMTGCTITDVKKVSARAAQAFVVRPLSHDPLAPLDYYNARDGLRAVISAMSDRLSTATVHLNAKVTRLAREGGTFRVETSNGSVYTADQVVLAAPPHTAGPLAAQLPGAAPIAAAYARFPYFPAQISIHRDPVYMPADPKTWSAFNATLDGDHCEATMSYGVMRDVEVYKSWTVNRRRQPQDLITKFDYLHPLLTPDSMLAQRDLRAYQGQEGLWFAGSHVFDVDSQESAVYSAIQVAKALAPNSANLTRLGPLPASPAEP